MADPTTPDPASPRQPQSSSFDPGIYLIRNEPGGEPSTRYRQHIFENRFRLYRAYEGVVPKPDKVTDEDDEACFVDFVETICLDMKVSYGITMFVYHMYLCSIFWQRAFYCPKLPVDPPAPLSWVTPSSWLSLVVLPLPRLSGCPTRPQSFVDVSSAIQMVFYVVTFVARWVAPELDVWMIHYGSYMMNGTLWLCFWLARSGGVDGHAGWVLLGGGAAMGATSATPQSSHEPYLDASLEDASMIPGGRYGSWNALWTPIILWFFYLIGRRNFMGIVNWQHRTRLVRQLMSCEEDLADETDAAEFASGIVDDTERDIRASRRRRFRTWYRFAFNLERWLFLVWMFIAPMTSLVIWYRTMRRATPEPDDMPAHIPVIWTIVISIVSTVCLQIWYSYLNFQIACVVWTKPYREGNHEKK